jgi:eukaryotic-like serine/threonine-protein kinase
MIGRTFSHYRLTERLGAGSMGEVYKAHDQHLDRDVAIKVLPPGTLHDDAARRRFRREAEALSRLNNAHIATVHDFDSADGVDFLVMEYVSGRTLSEHIGHSPLPEREMVTIAGDIAAALEEAHERGVVHRDLKPGNIMVTAKGRVKVLDFGIARLSGTTGDFEQTATQTAGDFVGTLPYMAPEQVRGEAIDSRTDIYALGVVLFEMSTGRRPFDDTHTGRLTDAILHAPVTPPTLWQPKLNSEIERIVLKCLERDPDNRYQSAKEVAIDLRRLASPTVTQPPPAVPARRMSARQIALAATVAIAVVGVAVLLWIQRGIGGEPGAMAPESVASIVVLPSKILAQASDQFLTDAIPNTISAHLTQVKGLETKVPPSSVEVDRVQGDLGRLADAYGVSAFVLSSLTAESDRLVLNVQLVEARSRRLLWSRDFEGKRGGYLALARGAAEELRNAVRPATAPLAPVPGTSNSEAELAYLRGMHHFNRYNYQHDKAEFDQGLAAFQRALTLDPRMADAAAGIAWLHEFAIEAGSPVDKMLPEMRRWAQRAVSIDDGCSRAWAALAFAELISTPPRTTDALIFGLRSATRGPRDAFAINGVGHALWGTSSSLALATMQEAARVDPLYLYPPLNSSELLAYLSQPNEALAQADAVLRLEPDMPGALIRKALALIELGRPADASALLPTLQKQAAEGRADPEFLAMIKDGVTLLEGDDGAKRAALDRLARQALNPGTFNEYPRVYVWLVRHGNIAGALNAIEQRARVGRVPYDFLRLTPEFKALATNERYVRALELARAQFDTTLSLLKEAEGRGELPAYLQQPLADLLRTLGISSGQRASLY